MENLIQKVDSLLKEAHFETFRFETSTKRAKFCFDLLVKKDNSVFLVKVFPNIDNLNESIVENIKILSVLLNSKPLLIGIKNRYQYLEDDTIYMREDLPFMTLNTLRHVLIQQKYPHIVAQRGGGIIFLDGSLMKNLRENKNISRKEISEELGVTKRTISSYENETMRPSQQIAENILKILEDKSIFRRINIFEWNLKFNFMQEESMKKQELTDFETHLQDIFEDIGVSTFWYKKGQVPFELSLFSKNYILNEGNEFYPVFSGLSHENSKPTKLNIEHLMSFAKIFHKNAFFIVNDDYRISDIFKTIGMPVIKLKDLEKIDTEDDFVELIEEN